MCWCGQWEGACSQTLAPVSRVSYRILSWGGKEDGSRMIVACESIHTRKCVYLLGGSGGMLPQENFEFRSSQIASDAIWDKLSKQHFDDTYLCPATCKIK